MVSITGEYSECRTNWMKGGDPTKVNTFTSLKKDNFPDLFMEEMGMNIEFQPSFGWLLQVNSIWDAKS